MDGADEARTGWPGEAAGDAGGPRRARRIPAAVLEAGVEAGALLDRARAEATRILALAGEEAARTVARGAEEGAAARWAAVEAGREEGLAEGRAEAAAQVLRAMRERERLLASGASLALDLAVAMAGRILEREVRPVEDALSAARRAIPMLGRGEPVVLRASPGDAGAGEAGGRDAVDGWPSGVRVLVDPSLGTGEVIVESGDASVDGTFRARLDRLRRALEREAG